MKAFRILFSFLVLIGCSVIFYLYLQLQPLGGNVNVVYDISSGSLRSHLVRLEKDGVLKNARISEFYARFVSRTIVQKGEYEFSSSMSAFDVLQILSSGKSISRPITFKEGINIFEMSELIEKSGLASREEFLKKVQDPAFVEELLGQGYESLEGYLYPETYYYEKNMPLEILLRSQVRHFFSIAEKVAPEWTQDRKTLHQNVILASMVEKETGAPEERPTIASVFYNRLKKGMRLQSDPTIIYGIAMEKGHLINNIRKADILHPSSYNTYVVRKLPKAPIANPGIEALKAVKNPAQTDYLYFVSMNEGRHYFSKTYKEHNEAVKTYQLNRKAREGKSWRNMKK